MENNNNIYVACRFLAQPITGVQRYGIELSKAIKKLNTKYNITFLAPPKIIHNEIARFLNAKKIGILNGHFWDQISLLKFLKSQGNPLIINFSNTLPVFYKNKIVTIHDIIHLKYPTSYSYSYRKYYEIVFPLMLKYSRHIITISEFSKEEICSYFGINKERVSVVYPGISNDIKPKKIKNKEKYILGVSSIAHHKNFSRLIEAFLKLNIKDIKLYIVGGLNEKIFGKDSKKILNKIKNNNNIKFLGRVDDNKLIELYSNAVCFVYPSLYEGFGLPPLEAQKCGCPVVVSDIPVFKEVYGDSVVYCNPLDTEDIANKIKEVVNDRELKDYLTQKGTKNAERYIWEKSALNFLEVIEKTIHND